MQRIVHAHFPDLAQQLLANALRSFYEMRQLPGLKKKPSTSELLDWIALLLAEQVPAPALRGPEDQLSVPPLVGALLKNEQDLALFEKLLQMQRQHR